MTHPHSRKIFSILFVLCGLLAAQQMVTIKEQWVLYENPAFQLLSAAKPASADHLNESLRQYHMVLQQRIGDFSQHQLLPTRVLFFKDERSFAPYLPPASHATMAKHGFFLNDADVRIMALSGKGNIDRMLLSPYGAALIGQAWPAAPWWLRMGLADYFGTFSLDKKGIHYGAPIKEHTSILSRSEWITWDRLLSMSEHNAEYQDDGIRRIAEAQAWALVHYLSSTEKTPGVSILSTALVSIRNGNSSREALTGACPVPSAEWQGAVRGYLKRKDFPGMHAEPLQLAPAQKPGPLAKGQILVFLGDLLVRQGSVRADWAEAHFKSAQTEHPQSALAEAGLGQVALLRDDMNSAIACFRSSVNRDKTQPWLHYQLGSSLLRQASAAGLDAAGFAEARAAFEQTLSLRPDFREAEIKLAETYLLDDTHAKGKLLFEKALVEMPLRLDVARGLLHYYVAADDTARIHQTLEHIRRNSGARAYEAAQETVLRQQIDLVASLIKKQNYGKAVPLASRLRRQSSDPALIALLDEAQSAAQQGKWVDIYNRGVRSAADKKYDQAERFFKQVMAGDADADLRDQAKANLAKVRIARQAAWYNAAFDLMRANDFDKAIPLFKKVIQDNSDAQTTRAARSALDQIEQLMQ